MALLYLPFLACIGALAAETNLVQYTLLGPGFRAEVHTATISSATVYSCGMECSHFAGCKGFNFNNASFTCELVAERSTWWYTVQRIDRDAIEWHLYEKTDCQMGLKDGPHCHYMFVPDWTGLSWTDARIFCLDMGLDMVMIKNLTDSVHVNNDLEADLPYNVEATHQSWLGATKVGEVDRWLDGSDVTFTDFSDNNAELNSGDTCTKVLHEYQFGWKWWYEPCQNLYAFVCERRNA